MNGRFLSNEYVQTVSILFLLNLLMIKAMKSIVLINVNVGFLFCIWRYHLEEPFQEVFARDWQLDGPMLS